uniref:Uncharacterized protein n=1 Tax=Gossypium raimondii TaxID=29730 RepID=A0A0D2RZA6_GOSRA|nr:hypothetical protein B456_012G072700 [Gossypium raimondii]
MEEFNIWEGSITEVDQWRTKKRANPNLQVLTHKEKCCILSPKGVHHKYFYVIFCQSFTPFFFFFFWNFKKG